MPINSWATAVLLGAARRRGEIYTLFFFYLFIFDFFENTYRKNHWTDFHA